MKCKGTAKNSPFCIKNVKRIAISFTAILWLIFGAVCQIQAQMFSVGGETGPRYDFPFNEFYGGLEIISNNYKGGNVSQTGEGAFEFEGPVIRLGYNSAGFDIFIGTGGSITGIDDVAYFDVGGNIDFGIPLYRSKVFHAQLPFRIASRYTNITNSSAVRPSANQFQFGNVTGGAGLRFVIMPAENIRLEMNAVPSYGFSFASGGFFGGSLGEIAGGGRLYFDRLFDDIGLSLGYKYDQRNYDIDRDVYDYKMDGHSVNIGITF